MNFFIFKIYDWIMSRYEKILLFFGVILISFCFIPAARAAQYVDQQFTVNAGYAGPAQWMMSPFVPQHNNIAKFTFSHANLWTSGKRWEVFICKGTISTSTYGGQGCGSSQQVAYNIATSTDAQYSTMTFSTTTSQQLFYGQSYFFAVHTLPYSGQFTWYGQSTTTNSQTFYSTSETITGNLTNQFSIQPYFIEYYDDSVAGLSDLQISLLQPASGDNVGLSSPVFRGQYRDDGHLASDIVLSIYNYGDGSYTTKSFSLASTTYDLRLKTFGINLLDDVGTPMGYSKTGTSSWTAYLKAGSSTISNIPPPNVFYSNNASTSAILANIQRYKTCQQDDTSTWWGQFSCAFKLALYDLIYPSQASIDGLSTSGQNLKSSFPFTVYFQLTDTLSNTISSTTLSSTGTIGIPMIDTSKHIYIAPFLSSSSLPNAVGSANATLIRNTISWLIWLILAILIFFEVKSL